MTIYVVIVTYNGAPWIRGALDSLRASELPCVPVVVDNASTDDTIAIVTEGYPEARLMRQSENVGFGLGNNAGIALALRESADAVFLLNQDAYITPPALRELWTFLVEHPEFSVVSPLHCSPDTNSVDPQTLSGYLHPYARGYLSDACLGGIRPYYEIRGINAAAWMVRSEAFRHAGGFDPLFFMYGEDDDLITRFQHHGQRFALLPSSRIVHLRARSPRAKKRLPAELWWTSERARSHLILDLKRPGGTVAGKLLRLFADGVLRPLAQFISDHDWKAACAYLIATGRLLASYPSVSASARLCSKPGAHFLDA